MCSWPRPTASSFARSDGSSAYIAASMAIREQGANRAAYVRTSTKKDGCGRVVFIPYQPTLDGFFNGLEMVRLPSEATKAHSTQTSRNGRRCHRSLSRRLWIWWLDPGSLGTRPTGSLRLLQTGCPRRT